MLRFDVITIFPNMFVGPMSESMLARAAQNKLIEVNVHNLRDYTTDKHRVTDDYPYGGGAGMVMKPEPVFAAVNALRCSADKKCNEKVVLLTPQGRTFSHAMAEKLAQNEHIIFICGHYEGIDERIREHLVDNELSIGDYVLTGGELPAMVVIDAVSRMVQGVVGAPEGPEDDSFANGLLEYPQYTRPEKFNDWQVPDILLSGNHAKIERWRRQQALMRTLQRRPDLLEKLQLDDADKKLLEECMKSDVESDS